MPWHHILFLCCTSMGLCARLGHIHLSLLLYSKGNKIPSWSTLLSSLIFLHNQCTNTDILASFICFLYTDINHIHHHIIQQIIWVNFLWDDCFHFVNLHVCFFLICSFTVNLKSYVLLLFTQFVRCVFNFISFFVIQPISRNG